ncbi:SGNH/GDSL hydrolase family protein [Siphonobacter sp. SORGH_AS_1065]|uniref:SGNH/GDSL hydrolase family protein n=1 Tax=Siphonobacter sp. SORGH_AS_1065 TaxID=3041795 RepID=UPI0027887F0A|nr:SGNH/GDSL hydrolase family protein [Siphonobacter sp. SORGH_AS_1065]MDQ1089963.1 lysophospholipase L1-like esterase [Siphonobacter sp. SORGH_AS_1065]
MKSLLRIITLFFCFPTLVFSQTSALENATLLRAREGLPFFFEKIKAGKPIMVGYLGGSITEAGKGWREQSLSWLQKTYPQVPFRQINAGVGGTGSDLGVFRVQTQVLDQNPDLVFVEFAVNDNGKKPEQIYKAMEGIVRKTWRQNPHTDLCFVYTLTADLAPTYQQGKLPASALAMEQIAEYYGIPSICLGLEVAALAQQGKLIFKGKPEDAPDKIVFSVDNVHPYPETGHRLYTEALAKALKQMADLKVTPQKRVLAKPFVNDNWEAARMIAVDELKKQGNWTTITPNTDSVTLALQQRFSSLIKSSTPGDYLEVKMKGLACGLYDVMGPGTGQYSMEVDQDFKQTIARFDAYCTDYRSNFFVVPTSPNQTHVIRFKVSDEKVDKAAILKTRNQVMNDPSRFQENACYAGKLLLVGEIVP